MPEVVVCGFGSVAHWVKDAFVQRCMLLVDGSPGVWKPYALLNVALTLNVESQRQIATPLLNSLKGGVAHVYALSPGANDIVAHPSHRARYNPMRLLDAPCSSSRGNEYSLALSMG